MGDKQNSSYLSLLSVSKIKTLLSFGIKGYLAEIGWFKAFKAKSSVDKNGAPIPWVTYSFIDFIQDRITKDHSIFEYGSGNSTLYYAKHAAKVVSVEHDEAWIKKISKLKPENAELIFCELVANGKYSRMPTSLGAKFDIIIVDGRDRANCCMHAISALSNTGVLILDDSERQHYATAINFLINNGFKHLSFSGISPGVFFRKSTSVFYKEDNCLRI